MSSTTFTTLPAQDAGIPELEAEEPESDGDAIHRSRGRRQRSRPNHIDAVAVLSAVRVDELTRRAEELAETVSATACIAEGVSSATSTFSPAVSAATRGLTSLLLAARSAQEASVAGTQSFASVPLPTATDAVRSLSQLITAGCLQRPGALLVPLSCESGAVAIARAALDAALATLLLAATPGIDARLVSEDALAGVLTLLRLHLVSHILPAFDPLDDAWVLALGAPATALPKLGTSKVKGKRTADNDDFDSPSEDAVEAAREDLQSGVASKVTKAVLGAAQSRIRPVIVAVCEVFAQLTAVLAAVKVADSLVRPLEEVCLLAATQTDASSAHIGSSSAKASAAASALAEGTAASSPEASLQVSSSPYVVLSRR